MKTILSITSLVLLLTACGGKQEKVDPPDKVEIPASIKPTVDDVFPLSEVASDVEFVQLEVTDESLLGGELRSVHVSDSHILVDDYEIICLYTRKGKFLTRIGRKGQGPEEYVFVVCAVLVPVRHVGGNNALQREKAIQHPFELFDTCCADSRHLSDFFIIYISDRQ